MLPGGWEAGVVFAGVLPGGACEHRCGLHVFAQTVSLLPVRAGCSGGALGGGA